MLAARYVYLCTETSGICGADTIWQIYCSSKAAIRAFSDALRKELVGTRIRIMTVDPGQVLTVGQVQGNRKIALADVFCRNSTTFGITSIRRKQIRCTREYILRYGCSD
jgi:NAD(P)-dependent dehydrogenase (short-subunit alcohol dehydrogenase family)